VSLKTLFAFLLFALSATAQTGNNDYRVKIVSPAPDYFRLILIDPSQKETVITDSLKTASQMRAYLDAGAERMKPSFGSDLYEGFGRELRLVGPPYKHEEGLAVAEKLYKLSGDQSMTIYLTESEKNMFVFHFIGHKKEVREQPTSALR
jgi:hypothetical protein